MTTRTAQFVRNITARLLDAMTGKRWLAYSTDSSRVCQFDIDFYCSEFRLTRICLVISLCLNIIYREMGRNLPVYEDVVQVVFTLRSDGWSHSQIGVHFGKSKSWAKYVLAAYSVIYFTIAIFNERTNLVMSSVRVEWVKC